MIQREERLHNGRPKAGTVAEGEQVPLQWTSAETAPEKQVCWNNIVSDNKVLPRPRPKLVKLT